MSSQATYRAATTGAAVFDRSGRGALRVSGRAPGQMLAGITSGRIPAPLREGVDRLLRGRGAYSTILTPKGRMVTDLRLLRLPGEEEAFLIDLPAEGTAAALDHLERVLPPRFATMEPSGMVVLTVVGPEAAGVLTRVLHVPPDVLTVLAEDEVVWALVRDEPRIPIVRTGEVGVPAFDIWVSEGEYEATLARLVDAGAAAAGPDLWETLRVEAGRPRFGVDMTTETIPIEAGIEERAIDHEKGCYTGQEVIVRIRHRGHVNRHLRGLLLPEGPLPSAGSELYVEDRPKAVGWITSVAESPGFGRPIALAYVRREVEPGGWVNVGGLDGPVAEIRALTLEGWVRA